MHMKKVKNDVKLLEAALVAVLKNPTKETWNSEVKQRFRSVGNTLGNFAEFKDIWPVWQKFDGLQAEKHPDLKGDKVDPETEKRVIIALVREAAPHLETLKQRLG